MKSNFTKETVDSLAKKVLIELSPEENKMVLEDLEFIEANMNLITQIDGLSETKPMTHPFDLYEATLRDDTSEEEGIPIEVLLRNSDKTEDREIEVPKVVG